MIEFSEVTKIYSPNITAVDSVSVKIEEGETFVLLGTSGCGKTTTLKLINKLIDLTSGTIIINGKNIADVDSIQLRRSIGYVIQHIGLFPHFTVRRNVGLVPELLGWRKEKINYRVDELLNMVGLDPEVFSSRYPAMLSGGQQQRVGLARALAADAEIILMDEPFGALDPITRETLQSELSTLWNELNKTVVFVTHDIFEAVRLGNRIGIMDKGKLLQVGIPVEVIRYPANSVVASFFAKNRFQLELLTQKINSLIKSPPKDLISVIPGTVSVEIFEKISHEKRKNVLCIDENKKFVGLLPKEFINWDENKKHNWLREHKRMKNTLLPTSSLLDAIDLLRTIGNDTIAVVDVNNYLKGILEKKSIVDIMSKTISD